MRYIVMFILAVAILITIAACSSKSGKLAEKRQSEVRYGISAIVVMHNTGVYKVLNDSVAMRMADNAYFLRKKDPDFGDWRYFRVE